MSEAEKEARRIRELANYVFTIDQVIVAHEYGQIEAEDHYRKMSQELAKKLGISEEVQEELITIEKEGLQKQMYMS